MRRAFVLPTTLKQIIRLFHTIRHLRFEQIYYRLWFRYRKPRLTHARGSSKRTGVALSLDSPTRPSEMLGPTRFRFLNLEADIEHAGWDSLSLPKLWRYNLHYFDYINRPAPAHFGPYCDALISRWIAENPASTGSGWEPYPTSLRIVNWIKWDLRRQTLNQQALDSLMTQARWLRKRLEFHLLGNHLIANAKALIFAGLFFDGEEANEWHEKGLAILQQQLSEQVLADGGHFELSPMYQRIILEDLLDIMAISKSSSHLTPAHFDELIQRMLDWTTVMRHPDSDLPFFNDCALSIAPSSSELDSYARRAGYQARLATCESFNLESSGYIKLVRGNATAFLDVGQIGPDYLPGHAHADSLSFELSLFGRRICVNSGTSTYDPGDLRAWQRSTAAHNTVRIDGHNSSDVWSSFRVGRRARARIIRSCLDPDEAEISASHDGYTHLQGNPVHKRTWQLNERALIVDDQLSGFGAHTVESFIYFHPDVAAHQTGPDEIQLRDRASNEFLALLSNEKDGELSIESGYWYPEFGTKLTNQACIVRSELARLPVRIKVKIDWADRVRAELKRFQA